jgi:hypothetical protein
VLCHANIISTLLGSCTEPFYSALNPLDWKERQHTLPLYRLSLAVELLGAIQLR